MQVPFFARKLLGACLPWIRKKVHELKPYQRSGFYHVLADFPAIKDDYSGKRITLILPSVLQEHLTGGPATLVNYVLAIKDQYPDYSLRLIPVMVPFNGDKSKLARKLQNFEICNAPQDNQSKDCILSYASSKAEAVPVCEHDIFIASMWPTFYLAKALKDQQHRYFGASLPLQYIIQDYESSALYSWSSFFLMAEQTYAYPDDTIAVVGTQFLADYLKEQGHEFLEVYAFNPIANAVLTQAPPAGSKKELFVIYGRPDTPRNCFDLIYEALLQITAEHPSIAERMTFVSVGEKHNDVPLNNGSVLESRGFLANEDYKTLIQETSVACFFVVSPHTGYVGLEFAHAGAITVSNSFRNKNILSLHPNIREPATMRPKDVADAFVGAIQETWRNPDQGIIQAKTYNQFIQSKQKNGKSGFDFIPTLFSKNYSGTKNLSDVAGPD